MRTIYIYKTLPHCVKYIAMSLTRCVDDVLCGSSEMQESKNAWATENRQRVFAQQTEKRVVATKETVFNPKHNCHPPNTSTSTQMPQLFVKSTSSASALASYEQVIASRVDLPSGNINISNSSKPSHCSIVDKQCSDELGEHKHATSMAVTEKKIIMSVCDTFMAENIPYCGSCATLSAPTHMRTAVPKSNVCQDVVSHACCAYVTPVGASISKRIYLQMAAPSRQQIEECSANENYNKNVQVNVTAALSGENIPVVFSQVTGSVERGTIHINPNTTVKPLGTTECCEKLLFGKNRTTSSPGFAIGMELGSTYANAVRKYQQYGNVSIGDQITLVPMIHKRAPMVISMSCPELNLSQVITTMSGQQTHARFGPNHPARAVEVLANLTPFVQQCCEASMNLPQETIEDLQEDNDMPVPTCKSFEHCFAHDPAHGVGAYVATHVFSLPTAILNTHLVDYNEKTNTGVGGGTPFPLETQITVHVASLCGGAVTDRGVNVGQ